MRQVRVVRRAPYPGRPDRWFVDLFAGCGGFSLGFMQAGWRHAAANECWLPAAGTYRRNLGGEVVVGDVRDGEVFDAVAGAVTGRRPLVVIGGPPCQGFSMAGNRNPIDPRGQLWRRFVDFVDATNPEAFVMENVKGLKSMKHVDEALDAGALAGVRAAAEKVQRHKDLARCGRQRPLTPEEEREFEALAEDLPCAKALVRRHLVPLLPAIASSLERAGDGYEVRVRVLNAAHYGVPQFRERVFVVGYRRDVHERLAAALGGDFPFHPAPTHADADPAGRGPGGGPRPLVSAWEAIHDLADAPEGALPNHVFTRSRPEFVERIARTPPGGTVYPNYTDAWYRLLPDRPARTVKENHGGVHCHPFQSRVLTPRELARLQTFPDWFVFEGTKGDVLKQIGNAVPPLLARAVGEELASRLAIAGVEAEAASQQARGRRAKLLGE
ncbi:MAG: hypothetical protein Kow0069_14500 [Promethearchaeota archaeon]